MKTASKLFASKSSIILILFLAIFLFKPSKSNAQWVIMSKETDSLVQIGSRHIYNIQFDDATSIFNRVIEKNPKHPVGYFLKAMVEYWRLNLYRYTDKLDQDFLSRCQETINICDKALVDNPNDIGALFFKGGILGYRGRFYANKQDWFKSLADGQEAFEIMRKCQEKVPGNHDIMLGTGIYSYFAEAIPEKYPIVKPLMTFLPSGNKKLGILQLKASALYSRYTPIEAKYTLYQIFNQFENDNNEAMYYSQMLYNDFPRNPIFHRNYARCLVRNGEWDSAEVQWRLIVNKCLSRETGYDNLTGQEGCYYVGLALERKRDFDTALKYLFKCDEISRKIEKEPSGWRVNANLKIGFVYDQKGDRKKAIEWYKNVLSLPDMNDSHTKANNYIKNPYK